jgi:hypothetical protein
MSTKPLDVRIPMGSLFLLLGTILAIYGLLSDTRMYAEHSLGQNVNLWWGLIYCLFGAVMLGIAFRSNRTAGK